jgi:hypothetical protein
MTQSWVGKKKVNSGELGRRELYLYIYIGGRAEPQMGAFAETKDLSAPGLAHLIFENSILGLSSPSIRMNLEAGGPRPSLRRPEPIEGALRATFTRPKTIEKPT